MIKVDVDSSTSLDIMDNIGILLLGNDRVRDIHFHIGNYWEQRKSGLDPVALFREMKRIFKKKKKVKELMNCSRDEAVRHMIEKDIENILNVWNKKIRRLLVFKKGGVLEEQSLFCEDASIVIEEDSNCTVIFKGEEFNSLVDGRRSIVGRCSCLYERQTVDKEGEESVELVRRKMKVFNNFTRRTFWRTTGKWHTVVEKEVDEKDKE